MCTQNAVNSRFEAVLLLLLLLPLLLLLLLLLLFGQDNAVTIITGMGWKIRCSIPGRGESFFSPTESPDHLWGLPRSYSVGTWVLSPVTKRLEHEIGLAPICTAVVKIEWSSMSPFPISLHGMNKDNLSTVVIITVIFIKICKKVSHNKICRRIVTCTRN